MSSKVWIYVAPQPYQNCINLQEYAGLENPTLDHGEFIIQQLERFHLATSTDEERIQFIGMLQDKYNIRYFAEHYFIELQEQQLRNPTPNGYQTIVTALHPFVVL